MIKSTPFKLTCPLLITFFSFLLFTNSALAETKTFVREYTYQASDEDSKNSSRTISLREVKRLLLEELGTYLESITEVQNFHLTKDQITMLTAGIVQTEIVDEKWDGHTYWLKSKIKADSGDVIKAIDAMRKDRQKTKELEQVKKRTDELLREVERLRKELSDVKDVNREDKKAAYDDVINGLTAIEWFEKGKKTKVYESDAGINAYTKAIELSPDFAEAYSSRGFAYLFLGNYAQAIKDSTKAIDLYANFSGAYFVRAGAYFCLGNFIQAIEDLDKAIELNPECQHCYNDRGAAYAAMGNYRQAIGDFDRAIDLDPNSSYYYYGRGTAYNSLGNFNQAIKDYSKAIKFNPKSAMAYNNRGVSYGNRGEVKQAIKDYGKAIELSPKYALAYFNRGNAYFKLRKTKQAFNDYKIAARLGHQKAQELLRTEGMVLEEPKKQPNMERSLFIPAAPEIKRDGHFIAYNNGTVLDTRTNLMWAAKDNGSDINWQGAKSYCENYRGGGYSDWRMPTQDELAGLYDVDTVYTPVCSIISGGNATVHSTSLITLSCLWVWASETRGSEAALFNFDNGYRGWLYQSMDVIFRALPVRYAK
ncbi:MAG: hypothetical protein CVU54_00965 [Deltaproteobacteria bacterium HGW-Deltaproteobacteria-12]|jgi:tetratricopeptide (TPR) repeat protein|nr:MAG: hypothetical protein CVU54_00965 [Deltaproteobacteria bacterium HGW-Deltaproteobacteria-12]